MEKRNEMEIDMLEIVRYIRKKIWAVAAATIVCAVAGFLVSALFMTPKYTASTRVYVLNRSSETAVVSSDFTLSNFMIDDYKVLITGRNVTKEVINHLGLSMTSSELSEKIVVTAPDNTRVLQISVTDENPTRAAEIANNVREVAATQIQEIMDVDAVNLVYPAEIPGEPTSPNVTRNTLLAAALGMIAAVSALIVASLMNDAIRTEEDVEHYLGLSTLGVIPASANLNTIGSYSQTGKNKHGKKMNHKFSAKK